MGNEFKKNHYFPKYNLNYWKAINSKLYAKQTKKSRNFNPSNNFYLNEFYYFDGTPNLEKRLGKIEKYMSQILKKISDSVDKSSIELSQYEINFIQLFLLLQASRQLNTTEVIKSDESGIYQSNNFFWGTHNLKTKEAMQKEMYSLVNVLESLIKKKNSKILQIWMGLKVSGTHLVIAKNNNNQICQSDVCCIIENDMDSNHLYTYFPQTPNIAFFLVKTKYFYRNWHRLHYLERTNDTEISPILEQSEIRLCCEYVKEGFSERSGACTFSIAPINSFSKLKKNRIKLSFFDLSNDIVNQYNKILFDDGTIFIHSQKDDYIAFLQSLSDEYRRIIVCEPDSETNNAFQENNVFKPLLRVQPRRSSDRYNPFQSNISQQQADLEKEINKVLDGIREGKTLDQMIADGSLNSYTFYSLPSNIFDPFMENISQRQTVELSLSRAIEQIKIQEQSAISHSSIVKDTNNQGAKLSGSSRTNTQLSIMKLVEEEADLPRLKNIDKGESVNICGANAGSSSVLPITSQGPNQESLESHRQETRYSSELLDTSTQTINSSKEETNQVEQAAQIEDTSGMTEYFENQPNYS